MSFVVNVWQGQTPKTDHYLHHVEDEFYYGYMRGLANPVVMTQLTFLRYGIKEEYQHFLFDPLDHKWKSSPNKVSPIGYFVKSTPNMTKENWLSLFGTHVVYSEINYRRVVEKGQLPVALVHRPVFNTAVIAYSYEELLRISAVPKDDKSRYKIWYTVPRNRLVQEGWIPYLKEFVL